MFESAELGHTIDKERYDREEPLLRHALLAAQYELVKQKPCAAVILIGGVDGAGKGETLNLLNEWMDPRHIQTNAMRPVDEEGLAGRPPMWRFWRALPPRGRIAIFVGSWYSRPLLQRVYGDIKRSKLDQHVEQILRFEQMLTDEGTLLLKFWLHLSREGQARRFKALARHKRTAWRVTDTDWKHLELYDRFQETAEHLLRATSTAEAPWRVVEGSDERYRALTIGSSILEALRARLDRPSPPVRELRAPPRLEPLDGVSVLDRLQLDQPLDKATYEDELGTLQGRLNRLTRHKRFEKLSVVAVFEGCDAAGKGGAIRRVTQALDARQYDVVPVAAPTDEEKARPYLWRFWRQLPERGRMAIFDRSWYGRVLVERVEGFCSEADWMRAFGEIDEFEAELVANRTVVVKFWLQISLDEQLRRFREREATPFKQHKITSEDWRNRDKWSQYNVAVCEMIERCSTEVAPWTLVEANNKYFARLKVLRTLADAIEAAL
ncbi:MAG TPA: polyphosphate:AMP phosphotransferase [Kofleriaceae bacterium]|nr:polyphosphate:AMP phosphotransferase [Kofleriaceae bacterium]